jgi:NDP-4-keto-2,6-dideoxyhexose 3-C-methyltransferase
MANERVKCRACDGDLISVLNIGDIYPSDFISSDNNLKQEPLHLVKCNKCDLVQLKHDYNMDSLYRQYWYKSSLNQSMVVSLQDIIDNILKRKQLKAGNIVVDIGANDGTLLSLYPMKGIKYPDGILKVGFDPAYNLKKEALKNCDYFINDFFTADQYKFITKASVVTTIAMFYDLPDPNKFIDDVYSILEDNGLWVIQFTDLLSMLKLNAVDNICHEHLEYYSFSVINTLLEKHGFEIFDVEYNNVNGGSIRAYVGKMGVYDIQKSVKKALKEEAQYLNMFDNPFEAFKERINTEKKKSLEYLWEESLNGKKIFISGASTKGNTLLQFYGLDYSVLPFAAEVNSDKFGKKTVGTNIPIISEERAIALNSDAFFILPWHFKNTFIKKYKDYINHGGILIFPLPEFHIITKEDLE